MLILFAYHSLHQPLVLVLAGVVFSCSRCTTLMRLLYWRGWSRLALFTCLMVDACYGLGHCLQKVLLDLITWHLGSKSVRKREALMCKCFSISACGTTANVPLRTASHITNPSVSVGETMQEREWWVEMRSSGAISVVFSICDIWFIVETLFPAFFTSLIWTLLKWLFSPLCFMTTSTEKN